MNTPQPLYNTIAGVQASFCVSYPSCVIMRVKCIDTLGSENDQCYIQKCCNEPYFKEVQVYIPLAYYLMTWGITVFKFFIWGSILSGIRS